MNGAAAERRVLDRAGGSRAMTGVVGVMVFLTVLAAALGLATATARALLDRQLAGRLTVQLVDGDAAARDAAQRRALAVLARLPQVENAHPVPRAELMRLLRPWLGDAAGDADLPIPSMIDVDLADGGAATAARVRTALDAAVPGVRMEAQAAWMSPVGAFMRSLAWLAWLLVALVAAATAAMVVLAARAGLETHRGTIEVMNMLGSTDAQVAKLFQRRLAIDAARGGGVGTLAGLGVVALVGRQVTGLGSELMGGAGLGREDWLALLLIPVGFVGLAMLAARYTVTRTLARRL